jgi:multidrug resistance protein, MATE family
MKYISKLFNLHAGDTYRTILTYFYPELITSLILYSGLSLIDSYFIAQLHITTTYTTLGVTNTLFHFITKIAEGFSVGLTILCGQYNGIGDYKQTGQTVVDAFWTTCLTGSVIALALYFSGTSIYQFYEVTPDMVVIGAPFLRLRAIGVFFNFICFALIGFLRGVKNTKTPMMLFMLGGAVFVFFDYVLIFGKLGFMRLEFQGSAMASILQYIVMLAGAIIYILRNADMRKYTIHLFSGVRWGNIKNLLNLSWPIMLDKATLAFSTIWLTKMVGGVAKLQAAHMSKIMLASFVVIRDLERITMLPAIALAQVITFLVSNDYRAHRWAHIHGNIKKILFLALAMLFILVGLFSYWPTVFLAYFDKQHTFTYFAARIIPFLFLFLLCDVIQLIVAAALRGAAQVKVVMWTRAIICSAVMFPLSYKLMHASIENPFVHFILVYGSLYFCYGLMGLVYIYYFQKNSWKKITIEENT